MLGWASLLFYSLFCSSPSDHGLFSKGHILFWPCCTCSDEEGRLVCCSDLQGHGPWKLKSKAVSRLMAESVSLLASSSPSSWPHSPVCLLCLGCPLAFRAWPLHFLYSPHHLFPAFSSLFSFFSFPFSCSPHMNLGTRVTPPTKQTNKQRYFLKKVSSFFPLALPACHLLSIPTLLAQSRKCCPGCFFSSGWIMHGQHNLWFSIRDIFPTWNITPNLTWEWN